MSQSFFLLVSFSEKVLHFWPGWPGTSILLQHLSSWNQGGYHKAQLVFWDRVSLTFLPGLVFQVCMAMSSCCFTFFFFFGGSRVWTQNFMLARQALYHLSHPSNPFCSG
jgi:hypothetical protein